MTELTFGSARAGSLPEIDDDLIYNSSPTFNPKGELVALHRKVHLFDIDIPGGITFKESDTLTGGDRLTLVDTGKSVWRGELAGRGGVAVGRLPRRSPVAATWRGPAL